MFVAWTNVSTVVWYGSYVGLHCNPRQSMRPNCRTSSLPHWLVFIFTFWSSCHFMQIFSATNSSKFYSTSWLGWGSSRSNAPCVLSKTFFKPPKPIILYSNIFDSLHHLTRMNQQFDPVQYSKTAHLLQFDHLIWIATVLFLEYALRILRVLEQWASPQNCVKYCKMIESCCKSTGCGN